LHVGHGRGAAYGATVANLLRVVGFEVDNEYYVNDAGRQMDILDCAGVGAKIGSIKCSAPTCADDIVLTGSNPQDIQTMINIAYLSIFCLFICSLCLYEWFLFVHNFSMIFSF
jgi:hypothetical protein